MKFTVLSDTHYISPLTVEGEGKAMIAKGDRLHLNLSRAMTLEAIRQVSEDPQTDTILITGDLTNSGDRKSHEEFIEVLRGLQKKGKRVWVTTATHDTQFMRGYVKGTREREPRFLQSPWTNPAFDPDGLKTEDYRRIAADGDNYTDEEITPRFFEACSPRQLWELYYDFGRKDAFSENEESYSYCCEMDDRTWVIMLNDNFRNIEATNNVSVTYPPSCFKWIRELVKRGKDEGKFVFACTHHPLLPPVPAYKLGATHRNMRLPDVGHALSDCGIDLVLSGHSHFCDVGFMRSKNGNLLCDITTPSPRSFPPQYRKVELDGQSGHIKTECVEIKSIPEYDFGGKTVRDFLREDFIREQREKIDALGAFGSLIHSLRVKHIYPICRKASGLSRAEYESIRETKIFDIIMELVLNMQSGDGRYTPDTPQFKVIMGFAAAADSIIDTQPFYDVRKKILLGYTCKEIFEPMLFNNLVPDGSNDFDFRKEPQPNQKLPLYRSQAGTYLLAVIWLILTASSPALTAAGLAAIPVFSVKKRMKLIKNPSGPLERY